MQTTQVLGSRPDRSFVPSMVVAVAFGVAMGVAASANAVDLFAAEAIEEVLAIIDTDDASGTVIGPFLNGDITGLAYDAEADILYGIHPGTDAIYTLDTKTGAPTFLVSANFGGNANGLAWVPGEGLLYASDNNSNLLLHLDPETLASGTVPIGGGFGGVEGLAYDPASDTLYGLADNQERIITIDRATGAAAGLPNGLGSGIWRGLAFDADSGLLFATRIGTVLISIDPATGIGTEVGTVSGLGGAVQGLATRPSEPSGTCTGDVDESGAVDVADLLGLLAAWGSADVDYDIAPDGGDGVVNVLDLLAVLGLWGPCP